MTKVQIKSEKLTPFGGLFPIMKQFDSTLSSVIDQPSVKDANRSVISTAKSFVLS